jgi:hypothetical protein
MNHINKIVDHKINFNVWNNVACNIERFVKHIVGKTVGVNVYFTISVNVMYNVSDKIKTNHNSFKYNNLQQYKDNL